MSFLLDYYKMPYEIVMSDELTLEEVLIMTGNRMAWEGYTNLKERSYQQEQEKKNKNKK